MSTEEEYDDYYDWLKEKFPESSSDRTSSDNIFMNLDLDDSVFQQLGVDKISKESKLRETSSSVSLVSLRQTSRNTLNLSQAPTNFLTPSDKIIRARSSNLSQALENNLNSKRKSSGSSGETVKALKVSNSSSDSSARVLSQFSNTSINHSVANTQKLEACKTQSSLKSLNETWFSQNKSPVINKSKSLLHKHTESSELFGPSGEDVFENKNFSSLIAQELKSNASRSVSPPKLVNKTLYSGKQPVHFKELGSFYGLPNNVKELIKINKGIDDLYAWQKECLELEGIKERRNLVYSLPTSGGKTLVAEILIFREILCRKRNAILVLPYVSIVQEKVWSLSPFGVALDFLIEEYAAGKGVYPPKKRRYKNSLYIATTEKALGIVNSLVEQNRLNEIGLVIVDELHLIGENERGATLEMLLTKLMYLNEDIQIVGMSATIGNLPDISKFLNAVVYTKNFRPVELIEYVKCEDKFFKIDYNADSDNFFHLTRKEDFGYPKDFIQKDPDRLGALVMEVVPDGSVLIFCATKANCENVASLLSDILRSTPLKQHRSQEKQQLLESLNKETGTSTPIFKKSIPFGIAYHHSGLTTEERRLIEDAYRLGILSIICCTSTLAAGVNLPAARVIIREPRIAKDFITLSRYKQMVGRAGRAGLGKLGESILICKREHLLDIKQLLMAPMDEVFSQMNSVSNKCFRYLFLSCINLGTACTRTQLENVANMTLLSVQQDRLQVKIKDQTKKIISDLYKLGAIEVGQNDPGTDFSQTSLSDVSIELNSEDVSTIVEMNKKFFNFQDVHRHVSIQKNTKLGVSKLGRATIKGNLDLRVVHMLYADLSKAQESLVLLDSLHLLYLVTPYNMIHQIKPNNHHFHNILMKLNDKEKKTATIIGITDACIVSLFTNRPTKLDSETILPRFYIALMLYDLWNEKSLIEVVEKYQISRGLVQNLMSNASTFASNVISFCEELKEFWPFAQLLKGINERLAHCCSKELIPLMELPAVKQNRARQLYNAGYKNLQSIAKANPQELMKTIDFMSLKVANQMIAAAKLYLVEKVETLREKTEDVLEGIETFT